MNYDNYVSLPEARIFNDRNQDLCHHPNGGRETAGFTHFRWGTFMVVTGFRRHQDQGWWWELCLDLLFYFNISIIHYHYVLCIICIMYCVLLWFSVWLWLSWLRFSALDWGLGHACCFLDASCDKKWRSWKPTQLWPEIPVISQL